MISITINGKAHELPGTWEAAERVYTLVGDPHRLLAKGGELGLMDVVGIVAAAADIPKSEVGDHAMRVDSGEVYAAAQAWLLSTLPHEDDVPDTDGEKKE